MKKNFLYFIEGINFGGQQSFYYNVLKHLDFNKINIHIAYVDERVDMMNEYSSISKSINRVGDVNVGFKKNISSLIKLINQSKDLSKIIEKYNIDIISCNGFYTFIVTIFNSIFKKKPIFRFIGGDLRKQENQYYSSSLFNWIYNIPSKYFAYPMGNVLLKNIGLKNNKIVLNFPSHKAVDSDLFIPKSKNKQLLKKFDINKNDFVIGWVGRLTYAMEVEETFDVFEKLIVNSKSFKLLVVGDGPLKQKLINRSSQNNYIDRVIFTGKVNYSNVPEYISLMDLVPLIDNDPHGGSILREAMSCGKVVVTVNGKSKAQETFIDNNKNGFLIEPKNRIKSAAKIIKMIKKNRNLKKDIELNARKKVIDEFSFPLLSKILQNEILNYKN